MKLKLLIILLGLFVIVGCTTVTENQTIQSQNEVKEDGSAQIPTTPENILQEGSSDNFSIDEEEITRPDPFYNPETGEFSIPPELEGEDIVFVRPPEPKEPVLITSIFQLESEVDYPDNLQEREVPLTESTILDVEREFIIDHYEDFFRNRGFDMPDERDIILHYAYVSYLDEELWLSLMDEGGIRSLQ